MYLLFFFSWMWIDGVTSSITQRYFMRRDIGFSYGKAYGLYLPGLKRCPKCVPLWLSLATLEEKTKGLTCQGQGTSHLGEEESTESRAVACCNKGRVWASTEERGRHLDVKGIAGVPEEWHPLGCRIGHGPTQRTGENKCGCPREL